MHVEKQRLHGNLRDRCEILDRVERQLLVQRGIDDVAVIRHQQRVSVRRGLGDDLRDDAA